jgi:hypothetical protein
MLPLWATGCSALGDREGVRVTGSQRPQRFRTELGSVVDTPMRLGRSVVLLNKLESGGRRPSGQGPGDARNTR